MTCGIYSITHTSTGRRYVGSSNYVERRWGQHRYKLRRGIHRNRKLQAAWDKYGESSFVFSVEEVVPDESWLVVREQEFLDGQECHFNISRIAGRERAGAKHSPEAILKMSKAHKGFVVTEEHRMKLSIALKGRQFSAQTRARISEAKTGRPRKPDSDETKRKKSEACKGRVHSQKTRRALSVSHLKLWEGRSLSTNPIVVDTDTPAKELAVALGVHYKSIKRARRINAFQAGAERDRQ